MRKKKKLNIFALIVIIIGGGMALYNNYFHNIDSNRYLSSINEDKSIDYDGTHKSDKNSESFDFKKFDGKWSLMQFTSNKGNINFTTPNDGKYSIRIIGANASGNFAINVSASNNIDISHKDFFD
ncbi:hypothetical protein WX45_00983 [Clostridium ljungdahlii DSM 13528]|uniref:Uncharacterized protein n=1 Tax=Clostridium ljungdahlii (strain ATCC 55383 / DSM 13528 / PETC) TaxID=748727 RepID=D8GN35_CLOLD|nr:hypothetical protein [Clostridium ljungdahlii]ADK13659.1 hypothetical protein CLJU_c05770 [Clostridium ljungdahlii DSM 13528]OAA84515.1 hypothetical protein WX45_00983 [Clostridium ljungdahlii DSM 13528]